MVVVVIVVAIVVVVVVAVAVHVLVVVFKNCKEVNENPSIPSDRSFRIAFLQSCSYVLTG